jgi:DNA-binding XRE family transcriptional regulator
MNSVKNLIERNQEKFFQFKPNQEFYNQIGINRKRWGQIFRGEISPTINEAKAIADFFHFDINELA